jgi:hypothetical protein
MGQISHLVTALNWIVSQRCPYLCICCSGRGLWSCPRRNGKVQLNTEIKLYGSLPDLRTEALEGQAVEDGTHVVPLFATLWPGGKKKQIRLKH